MGHFKTGKGYKPADLLSKMGKTRVGMNFIKKKFHSNTFDNDPMLVKQAFLQNNNNWQREMDKTYFKVAKADQEQNMHQKINTLSTGYYLRKLIET